MKKHKKKKLVKIKLRIPVPRGSLVIKSKRDRTRSARIKIDPNKWEEFDNGNY